MRVNNLKELDNLAKDFLKKFAENENSATIVGLSGNLGSGKTTFTQRVARILGVEETVTSPTFVILKTYPISHEKYDLLVHVDAYRLTSGEELLRLDWDMYLQNPKHLIFVEWPENVTDALPKNIQFASFEFIDETTREITFLDE